MQWVLQYSLQGYIGEKKQKYIGALIGGSTILFGIISMILFIIMVLFATPISTLMQAPLEALNLTATYVRICGAGIFFIVAYNVLSAIFRGLGDSKCPLLFVTVACLINVVGDLVLVAGFHLDAAGAAMATVLAQACSVLFALGLLKKRKLPFEIHKQDFKINPHWHSCNENRCTSRIAGMLYSDLIPCIMCLY